jgi:hypothetical protein
MVMRDMTFYISGDQCSHWWCSERAMHSLQDLRRRRPIWVRLCPHCTKTVELSNENTIDNGLEDVILPNQAEIDTIYKWEKI